jgi:hypothetical protein
MRLLTLFISSRNCVSRASGRTDGKLFVAQSVVERFEPMMKTTGRKTLQARNI